MKNVRNIAFGVFGAVLFSNSAFADCNYNRNDAAANCKAAAKDYFTKTQDNQGPSYEDVQKRVESFRDTLTECASCGMTRLQDKFNAATTSESSSGTNSTSSATTDSSSDPDE